MKTKFFLATVLLGVTQFTRAQIMLHTLPSGSKAGGITTDNNGNVWIPSDLSGGCSGIYKYDGTNFTLYDTSNSTISSVCVFGALVDANGAVWAGSENLDKFNGSNWTMYNSGSVAGQFCSMEQAPNGNFWMCKSTWGLGGLWVYNGSSFTEYNSSNSGMPGSGSSLCVAVESNTTIWLGTYFDGLLKFDGVNWTQYNTSTAALPSNYVITVDVDANNNAWVGFKYGGLAKFDGVNWTYYNSSNSPLPDFNITDVMCLNGKIYVTSMLGSLHIFDGVSGWQTYNSSNSVLDDNDSLNLAYDTSTQTLWMSSGHYDRFYSLSLPSSVNETAEQLSFSVYPNPVTSAINISAKNMKGAINIEVMNAQGETVQQKMYTTALVTLDISSLPLGVYFITLQDVEGRKTCRKFIKQ